jgi:hypothetical protein
VGDSVSTVIDIVIGVTLLEGLALWGWHRSTGRGLPPLDLLPSLGAGLCLMLALRFVLVGGAWPWIVACLLGSGVAHGFDLRRRWSSTRPEIRDRHLAADAARAVLVPRHPAAEQLDPLADPAKPQAM